MRDVVGQYGLEFLRRLGAMLQAERLVGERRRRPKGRLRPLGVYRRPRVKYRRDKCRRAFVRSAKGIERKELLRRMSLGEAKEYQRRKTG